MMSFFFAFEMTLTMILKTKENCPVLETRYLYHDLFAYEYEAIASYAFVFVNEKDACFAGITCLTQVYGQ